MEDLMKKNLISKIKNAMNSTQKAKYKQFSILLNFPIFFKPLIGVLLLCSFPYLLSKIDFTSFYSLLSVIVFFGMSLLLEKEIYEKIINKFFKNKNLKLINFLKSSNLIFQEKEQKLLLNLMKEKEINSDITLFNFFKKIEEQQINLNEIKQKNILNEHKIKLLRNSNIELEMNFLKQK